MSTPSTKSQGLQRVLEATRYLARFKRGLIDHFSNPKRSITVCFPVEMDDGSVRSFFGYRVLHNNVLGPGKGGLRFHPDLNVGEVASLQRRGGDVRLRVRTGALDLGDVTLGDSIAVNGVCLTAVELPGDGLVADVSRETLGLTTLGGLRIGSPVNLELALTPTSRLGGHLVTGHVDPDGDDSSTCRTSGDPCRTIQAALDAAFDGDVVEVGPGTYAEALDLLGKDLVLRGVGGADLPVLASRDVGEGRVVVLAASTTASEYGTGTVDILRAVTNMTWPVFFEEVWNVADGVCAVVAAALAAFLAPRKLSRSERFALRLWQEEQSDGHQ